MKRDLFISSKFLFPKLVLLSILALVLSTFACTTTAPFAYTESFNVSSSHYREIRRGPWETIGNTHYRLILDHEEKVMHVRGRGSEDEDMRDNFDFRTREPREGWFPGTEGTIRIHLGFLRRYASVREILFEAANEHPNYAIRVSGFSLGGTWTQLFLFDAIRHWPERDILAIFYAPANPWRILPKEYREDLRQRTVFVSSHWDPVTWMNALGFFRYGHEITIGRIWRIFPPQHYPPQMQRSLDEWLERQ